MATQAEIIALKLLIGDTELTDAQLGQILDAAECANAAAATIWGQKAAGYAELVNISEAGSSRSMGSLHQNALNMAKYYAGLGCPGEDPPVAATRTQTRAIERL